MGRGGDHRRRNDDLQGLSRPPAADGCVVRVEAAGAHFLDTLMIRGKYQVTPALPFIPGIEVAGTVVEAHPASRFQPGERICALLDHGAFAEYAAVPAIGAAKIPDDFPIRDAVSLPVIFPTAHLTLKDRAGLKAGETVLVHAGAGGVGSAAIQLARHWGARVIATAAGAEKRAICQDLGAQETIDYSAEPLVERVRDHRRGRRRHRHRSRGRPGGRGQPAVPRLGRPIGDCRLRRRRHRRPAVQPPVTASRNGWRGWRRHSPRRCSRGTPWRWRSGSTGPRPGSAPRPGARW